MATFTDSLGDLDGRLVRLRPGIYDTDPEQIPFLADGGFGREPRTNANAGSKTFRVWLGDTDGPDGARGWGRREWVERIQRADAKPAPSARPRACSRRRAAQAHEDEVKRRGEG